MLKVKKPKVKQVLPGIFLAIFDNQFDLAMTFCRFQETYESPKFRNKKFTFMEFVRWYSKTYGNNKFSYPEDWNGFNVPSHILYFVRDYLLSVPRSDQHEYDDIMLNYIMLEIQRITKKLGIDNQYYLIGVHTEKDEEDNTKELINHEVAHGLYYTNKDYKRKANKLVDKLPKKAYNILKNRLLEKGYCKPVIKDEIQAYMGTIIPSNTTKKEEKYLTAHTKEFKALQKEYRKNAKIPK